MQRKPTKNTRGPNVHEKGFQAWCKESECCACHNPGPSIVHHCEGATFKHNKVLVGHWFCIPLCQSCDDVVTHESRRAFREKFHTQSGLWWDCAHAYFYNRERRSDSAPRNVIDSIMDWNK